MKQYQKLAKDWAERNSSPGIDGRNAMYEILIAVQEQSYEAGFLRAREMAGDLCHDECGAQCDLNYRRVYNIGEEEVE